MVSVRASCLLHLASPKAAPCRAVPPRRTSLGAARGAPPTERCGAGAQRRRGSSWKLIFYRTPRKKSERLITVIIIAASGHFHGSQELPGITSPLAATCAGGERVQWWRGTWDLLQDPKLLAFGSGLAWLPQRAGVMGAVAGCPPQHLLCHRKEPKQQCRRLWGWEGCPAPWSRAGPLHTHQIWEQRSILPPRQPLECSAAQLLAPSEPPPAQEWPGKGRAQPT